jgi:hypothetical protein
MEHPRTLTHILEYTHKERERERAGKRERERKRPQIAQIALVITMDRFVAVEDGAGQWRWHL